MQEEGAMQECWGHAAGFDLAPSTCLIRRVKSLWTHPFVHTRVSGWVVDWVTPTVGLK